MTVYRFEFLKLSKNNKNLLLLISIFILLIFLLFQTNNNVHQLENDYMSNIESNIKKLTFSYNQLAEQIDLASEDSELENTLFLYKTSINELDEEYLNLKSNNWKLALQHRINFLISFEKLNILGIEEILYDIPENLPNDILHNQLLLKKNIKPIPKAGSSEGIYFVKIMIDTFTTVIGLFIIGCLFFDLFTKDIETNNRFLLFTQPFKKNYFFRTKIKMALAFVTGITIVFFVLFFLFGSQLSLAIGRIDYPIAVAGDTLENITSLPLYKYFTIQLLFWFLFVSIALLVIYYLSIILKNSMNVLALYICLMIIPYFFVTILSEKITILKITPFYFLSASEKIAETYISGNFSSFILTGLSSLLIVISLLLILIRNSENTFFINKT